MKNIDIKFFKHIEWLDTEWVFQYQTHKPHHYENWEAFKDSVKGGVNEPLILSVNPINKTLELTEGTHRIHAAHELKIEKVPVIIYVDVTSNYKFVNENIKDVADLMFRKPSHVFKEEDEGGTAET